MERDSMPRKEILYFESTGEVNTDETMKIAKERADELGIRDVVVASTRGGTGVKAVDLFKGYNVVVVPHVTGLREPGQQELTVENIEKILNYEEVDAVMVGSYDIAGSLGIPGQLQHPKVVEASKGVIEACAKHKKGCGTQLVEPDIDNLKKAFSDGYTFVVLASDIFLLWKWSEHMGGIIKGMRGK